MGIEPLRIDLAGRYLVIVVVKGGVVLSHGSTEFHLCAGQAAAVSVDELEAEILDPPNGESIFVLHLFHRMPGVGNLGPDSMLAALVEQQGRDVPGIFGFANSGQLRLEASPAGMVPENAVALLWRLYCCGLESTVRFIASAQGRPAAVKPKLCRTGLSLAHLPKPVAGLVW